jgi:hypothetical protein
MRACSLFVISRIANLSDCCPMTFIIPLHYPVLSTYFWFIWPCFFFALWVIHDNIDCFNVSLRTFRSCAWRFQLLMSGKILDLWYDIVSLSDRGSERYLVDTSWKSWHPFMFTSMTTLSARYLSFCPPIDLSQSPLERKMPPLLAFSSNHSLLLTSSVFISPVYLVLLSDSLFVFKSSPSLFNRLSRSRRWLNDLPFSGCLFRFL